MDRESPVQIRRPRNALAQRGGYRVQVPLRWSTPLACSHRSQGRQVTGPVADRSAFAFRLPAGSALMPAGSAGSGPAAGHREAWEW